MALTNCPECGNSISDKAVKCPHCGVKLVKCTECGGIIIDGSTTCPHCGVGFNSDVNVQQQQEPSLQNSNQHSTENAVSSSKPVGKLLKIIIPVLVLFIMAITVPDKSDHVKAIKSTFMEYITKTGNQDEQMGAALGANIIDKVLDSRLQVDNYFLFSVGKIETDKEDKTVSYGFLTHVFVTGVDKNTLDGTLGK